MFQTLAQLYRESASYFSRFGRAQHGATVVEFALIAPAFLATLIAVLETAIFLFAQQTLQTAALEAGRLFMTGQAQNGGLSQSQFTNAVCPMIKPLLNCNSLMVDVQSYDSFSSANASEPQLTYNAQGGSPIAGHTIPAPRGKSSSCALFINTRSLPVPWDLRFPTLQTAPRR